MNDAKVLIELENARCVAISTGDMDMVERTLADDYIHAHNTGYITNKSETLALFKLRPRMTARGDLTVRFYGDDFAVLTGPLTNTRLENGVEKITRAYATQVAVRAGGTWRFVSFHISFVPADKAA